MGGGVPIQTQYLMSIYQIIFGSQNRSEVLKHVISDKWCFLFGENRENKKEEEENDDNSNKDKDEDNKDMDNKDRDNKDRDNKDKNNKDKDNKEYKDYKEYKDNKVENENNNNDDNKEEEEENNNNNDNNENNNNNNDNNNGRRRRRSLVDKDLFALDDKHLDVFNFCRANHSTGYCMENVVLTSFDSMRSNLNCLWNNFIVIFYIFFIFEQVKLPWQRTHSIFLL